MHKVARQRLLLDILGQHGQAGVSELAEKMGVSTDTVRRDLTELEQQGLAQKNHGGAIALDLARMKRHQRDQVLPDIKQQLGRAVARYIPANSTIMLDAGSTTLAVARALLYPATVITTSLDIAHCLSDRDDIELILAGGVWDSKQRLFSGPATQALLERYRADIAIFGACAVHATFGVSASHEADADIKRALVKHSRECWLVTDHLKFDRCEPHAVASLPQFSKLFLSQPWPAIKSFDTLTVHTLDSKPQEPSHV